jgi:hypothetical protein
MRHVTAPLPGYVFGTGSTAPPGPLAALDEGIGIFAANACEHDPGGSFANIAMRLFFTSLYLGSHERARKIRRLASALGDGDGNTLRSAYASFFLMHYALRTGDIPQANDAYLELQRVERIPRGLMGPEAGSRTLLSVYDGRWTPAADTRGRMEIVLPSPPLLVRSYSLTGKPPGDRFPLQYVNGREGFRGILAGAEINRIRALALSLEPAKAQAVFDSAISRKRFGGGAALLVPAVCTAACAWAKVGDVRNAQETLSLLPPEPWPVRPVYGELKRLCIVEGHRFAGRLDMALEAYKSWPSEYLNEFRAVPWAIGTKRLAESLCKAGAVADAERLVRGMVGPGGGDVSVEALRARTLMDIMDTYAARGRFRKAGKLLREIESIGTGFHPSVAWTLYRGEVEQMKLDACARLSARLAAKGRPAPRPAELPLPAGPAAAAWPPADAEEFALAALNGRGPGYGADYADTLAAAVQAEAKAASLALDPSDAGAARPAGTWTGWFPENVPPIPDGGSAFPAGPGQAPTATGYPWALPGGDPVPGPRRTASALGLPEDGAGWPKGALASSLAAPALRMPDSPAEPPPPSRIARRCPPEAAGRAAAILAGRVESLLRRGSSREAARALAAFENLPHTGDAATARFGLGSKIIAVFGVEGDLRSACALYRSLAMSPGAAYGPWLMCRPALALMNASLAAGAPGTAADVFEGLRLDEAPPDMIPELGEAAWRTVRSLLLCGGSDRAESLHREMSRLGTAPRAASFTALAALDLVLAFESAGLTDKSMAVYLRMESSPELPEAERARGLALRAMLSTAARSGLCDRARALKSTVESFGNPQDAHFLRVRALHEMISLMSSERTWEAEDIPGGPGNAAPIQAAAPPDTASVGVERAFRAAPGASPVGGGSGSPPRPARKPGPPGNGKTGGSAGAAGACAGTSGSPRAPVPPEENLAAGGAGGGGSPASTLAAATPASSPPPPSCPEAARLARHLAEGNLHMAEAFFSIADLDDILPANAGVWAAVLVRLAGLYLARSRPEGAEKVFRAMGEACTGALPPMLDARSKAGARIVRSFSELGRLEDGLRVYGELASMAVTPGTAAARARAAAVLVPRLAASGRLAPALEIMLGLRSLPPVDEVREALSVTGAALISRLETLPEGAAELCRGMGEAGGGPENLSGAAARVMVFLSAAGRPSKACDFFLDFMARHPLESFPPDALRPIAWALATLAESCRSAGMTSQAQAVYRHLLHPAFRGVSPELRACLESGGAGCPGAGAPGLPLDAAESPPAGEGEAPAPVPCGMVSTCRSASDIIGGLESVTWGDKGLSDRLLKALKSPCG